MTLAKSPPGTTWRRRSSNGDPPFIVPKKRMKYVRKKSSQKKITGQKFCQTYKLRHCRWLIVDATLEASGAPIHELDGALGLDGCHCCVHILWHHVSSAANERRVVYRSTKVETLADWVHPIYKWKHWFPWLVLKKLWDLTWADILRKKQWVFSANGGFDQQQIRN